MQVNGPSIIAHESGASNFSNIQFEEDMHIGPKKAGPGMQINGSCILLGGASKGEVFMPRSSPVTLIAPECDERAEQINRDVVLRK